jgi:hypothetical protein
MAHTGVGVWNGKLRRGQKLAVKLENVLGNSVGG